MKVVNIEVRSDDTNNPVDVTVITETHRLGSWTRDARRDVTSGTEDAKMSIRIRPDQRIIIEGRVSEPTVFDREQSASITPRTQADRDNATHSRRADEPSKELPHPDNDPRVKQEMDRINKQREANKEEPMSFPPPPDSERTVQVRRTEPVPATRTVEETRTMRTPDSGVRPQNAPKQKIDTTGTAEVKKS